MVSIAVLSIISVRRTAAQYIKPFTNTLFQYMQFDGRATVLVYSISICSNIAVI
jgi:hypothetical protein